MEYSKAYLMPDKLMLKGGEFIENDICLPVYN